MTGDKSELAEDLVEQADSLFKTHRGSSISKVIGNLIIETNEITDLFDVSEKNCKIFDIENMTRVFLYKETCEFSQQKVADRIKDWPYLQVRFDLDRGPTQEHISYFKLDKFEPDYRSFLKDVAAKIRQQAKNYDITSKEIRSPEAEPDELSDTSTTIEKYIDKQVPELINRLSNEICSEFDTGRNENVVHEDEDVWEHQYLMSIMDRAGSRAAHRTRRKYINNDIHNSSHVRAVKNLGTPASMTFDDPREVNPDWRDVADTIQNQYNAAIDKMLDHLKPAEYFTQPVVAAIDTTHDPFHVSPHKSEEDIEPDDERIELDSGKTKVPKDDYPVMVEGGEESGEYHYTYATLTVVGTNAPLVIAVEPVRHDSAWEGDDGVSISWAEIVDRLMQQARKHLDIHLVMADRAFEGTAVNHVLDQYHNVNYLMPKTEDADWVKEDVEAVKEDPTIDCRVVEGVSVEINAETPYIDKSDPTVGNIERTNYSHDQTVMYLPGENKEWSIEKEGRKIAVFVSNRTNVSPIDALGFTNRYAERWDIENEYKMIKPLLPSIASTDYRMRFFSFIFATVLYNMWRIIDHKAKEIAVEKFDEYGRGKHEDRLDTVLPLADFIMTGMIERIRNWLDPPDPTELVDSI